MAPGVEEFSLKDLEGYDLRKLFASGKDTDFLRPMLEKADARLVPFTPITPEERLQAFREIGFRPHGLYVPDDDELADELRAMVGEAGRIEWLDDRLQRYYEIQDLCERWEQEGVVGVWDGQQALARSNARFRQVAWARRGGKTFYAAREALALAKFRPRSWVWLTGPTMSAVSRSFDMVVQLIDDLGISTLTRRDNEQVKLIVLENRSRIEGVTLQTVMASHSSDSDGKNNIAGAAIDLAVVDEAAQVTREAWVRGILPPLSDRNGRALLLSSWEGERGFFHDLAEETKKRAAIEGRESTWEIFQAASYKINFFVFPQGRQTPILKDMEREMDPVDFLEQFGGIPAGARNRVLPEMKEKVHVGSFPFDPRMPVVVAVDPSGGANPYAVGAFQDYGEYVVQIDEYYQVRSSPEEAGPVLDKRPWRENVTDMVIDSAYPPDIERFSRLGWPAYPVDDKPRIYQRLSLHRVMLRDPIRYHSFYRLKMNALLEELGLERDADLNMDEFQQREMALRVEEELSDVNLSKQDVNMLRKCSRLFINNICVNSIKEYLSYHYKAPRGGVNLREIPQDANNHILDLTGYFLWQMKRWDIERWLERSTDMMMPVTTIGASAASYDVPVERDPNEEISEINPYARMRTFLGACRAQVQRESNRRVVDFIQSV